MVQVAAFSKGILSVLDIRSSLFGVRLCDEILLGRMMEGDFESKALRFLQELHALAHGNPRSIVVGKEIAKRAGIAYTIEDYNPVARRLRDSGLIEERGTIGLALFSITPAGVQVVHEGRLPLFLT